MDDQELIRPDPSARGTATARDGLDAEYSPRHEHGDGQQLGAPKRVPPPKLKPKPPTALVVRDITKQVLDAVGLTFSPDSNNLVSINMTTASTFKVINDTIFTFGKRDPLQFRDATNSVGRIGIFAAKKGDSERAVILVVPKTPPESVLAVISANFTQNAPFFKKVGGGDPLSPQVIFFLLNSHLRGNHNWASQMLASSKQMAIVYIVRALAGKGSELGLFANDGAAFRESLVQMRGLTNNSFALGSVSAMTFSLGIFDFNVFVGAISKSVSVNRVINLDPQFATHAVRPKGSAAVEILSGETGMAPGFEVIDKPRWVNEEKFASTEASGGFKTKQGRLIYFHDRCIANYTLRLALEKS